MADIIIEDNHEKSTDLLSHQNGNSRFKFKKTTSRCDYYSSGSDDELDNVRLSAAVAKSPVKDILVSSDDDEYLPSTNTFPGSSLYHDPHGTSHREDAPRTSKVSPANLTNNLYTSSGVSLLSNFPITKPDHDISDSDNDLPDLYQCSRSLTSNSATVSSQLTTETYDSLESVSSQLTTETYDSLESYSEQTWTSQDSSSAALKPMKRKKTEEETSQAKYTQQMSKELKAIEREKKKTLKEELKRTKEKEREQKKKERLEMKKQKEFERAKLKTEKEAQRQLRPGECLKYITVLVDPGVLTIPGGPAILELLQTHQVPYDIQKQLHPNLITFWRQTTQVSQSQPMKLESMTKEVLEAEVLLFLPVEQFMQQVACFHQCKRGFPLDGQDSLLTFVTRVKSSIEDRNITLIIHGLDRYLRGQKAPETKKGRKRLPSDDMTALSRLHVEEALIDLQLHIECNVRFTENPASVAKTVFNYSKAVAETPFKRDRQKTGFSFHLESKGCVEVGKDGEGLAKLWRQQLQQFHNVSAEMSNAIVASYPSPWILTQAYKQCSTEKQKELLLQDIVVRRGEGVMATSRRIGKELSKKIYILMTSRDPNTAIK